MVVGTVPFSIDLLIAETEQHRPKLIDTGNDISCFGHSVETFVGYVKRLNKIVWCVGNASVTSHSRARTGCSRAVFNKNHTSTHGAHIMGPCGSVRILPFEIHSALRTRNRTGYKNRTGPMVGCDWGIRRRIIWLNAVLQLFDLPTNHNYALTKHLIFMPWAYLTYCYC